MAQRRPVRWSWAVVDLLVTLLLASLVYETGSCASGAGDRCATAPVGGWGAAWRAFRRER